MFKHLSLLCVAVLALVACGPNNNAPPVTPPAPAVSAPATPVAAATIAAPASAGGVTSASTASAPAPAPAPSQSVEAAPPAAPFVDTGKWIEGKHYFLIDPAQPTSHPGKIEVTEVFSYGCPACNAFHPTVDRIARSLPANAVMSYLAASFRPDENWPMYQRAFYAAQALGVAQKAQDAMFDATWKTGEMATYDLGAGKPKPRAAWPTIDDAAKFYARFGVDPKEFIAVANSFSVNTQMKRADDLMKAYGVDSTPTMVVNGKYRFGPSSAGGGTQALELTQWLVAKEAAGK